jgi:archaemetzincin
VLFVTKHPSIVKINFLEACCYAPSYDSGYTSHCTEAIVMSNSTIIEANKTNLNHLAGHAIFSVAMKKAKGKYIYILLIGEAALLLDLKDVEQQITQDFKFPTKISRSTINPEDSYNPMRKQYHSTKILKEMLDEFPSDALKIIGITSSDLFIPILTFVFGEAQLDGKVGIVSSARLQQEFYGLPPNQALLKRRLIKEIKHELGHTFGIVHCSLRECVMSVANNIADVDSKGISFCEGCRELLRHSSKRN